MSNLPRMKLSWFEPLERVISFDDFDIGLNGWTALIGNYEHTLGSMLSTGTMWDTGSAGSWDGAYAIKLMTRPMPGSLGMTVKRLTWRRSGPIQVETHLTFKPEAAVLELSGGADRRDRMRQNHRVIIERDVLWEGNFETEPYEAAWAESAIYFVRVLKGQICSGSDRVQISPDGLHWVDEGTMVQFHEDKSLFFYKVNDFETYLKLVADLPDCERGNVIVTLVLKA